MPSVLTPGFTCNRPLIPRIRLCTEVLGEDPSSSSSSCSLSLSETQSVLVCEVEEVDNLRRDCLSLHEWTGSCPVDQAAESEAGQNPEGRLRMRCSAGIRWNWALFCFTDRGRIILSRWYRFKQMLHASVLDLHVQIRYWVESWVRVGVCMESESSSTIRTCAVS